MLKKKRCGRNKAWRCGVYRYRGADCAVKILWKGRSNFLWINSGLTIGLKSTRSAKDISYIQTLAAALSVISG